MLPGMNGVRIGTAEHYGLSVVRCVQEEAGGKSALCFSWSLTVRSVDSVNLQRLSRQFSPDPRNDHGTDCKDVERWRCVSVLIWTGEPGLE